MGPGRLAGAGKPRMSHCGTIPQLSRAMSLVFPHTFVPWFRSSRPTSTPTEARPSSWAWRARLIAAGKLNAFVQDLAILHAMGIKLVLVHGFRPQVNEQLARPRAMPARYSPRRAHHRCGGARLRPGSSGPAALRDRSRVLARPAQHADGQCHGAGGVGQLPDGTAGRASSTAWISSTAVWCGVWMARPSRGPSTSARWCCSVAFRLFAHRRGLQPDHGRRGDQRRGGPAGRQAGVRLTEVPGVREDQPNDPEERHRHRTGAGRRRSACWHARPCLPPARTRRSTPLSTCSTA